MKHMYNNRKGSLLLLLCTLMLTLACVLCACGGDGADADTTVAETTGAEPAETTGAADGTETTGADEESTTAVSEETTVTAEETTVAEETTEAATEPPASQPDMVNADKRDYLLGEVINIKTYTNNPNWTINVYPADFVPGTDPALYWAYFEGAEGQDKTIANNKYVNMFDLPGNNKGHEKADPFYGAYLPAGDYKVILRDDVTGEEKASDTFTVLPPKTVENQNLALNMPLYDVSSSFEMAPSCGAAFVNDGTDAGWASGFSRNTTADAEEYITINLQDVYFINRVLLTPQVFWNNTTVFPENYEIQVSVDGEEYTTVASVTGDNDFDESVRVIDFEPVEALYVRFLATKLRKASSDGVEDFMVELDEMEVYYATDDSMVPEAKPATGVMTDKTTYYVGDTVNMTILSANLSYSVNLYTANAVPGTSASIYWSYLEGNADQSVLVPVGKPVNVTAMGGNNKGNPEVDAYYGDTLPLGEYKLCLIDDATGEIIFTATFSVVEKPVVDESLPATYLATDKTEYAVGETVNITVKAEEQNAWIAVYDMDGILNTTPTFRWAYLEGLSGAAEVIPQGVPVDLMTLPGNNAGNDGNPAWYADATEHLPAGQYKVLLLSEATGATLLEVAFTVA